MLYSEFNNLFPSIMEVERKLGLFKWGSKQRNPHMKLTGHSEELFTSQELEMGSLKLD